MSLRAVVGRPGHGKSLFLLWSMLNALRAGRMVATNMELTEHCPFAHRVVRLDVGAFPVFQLPSKATQLHPAKDYAAYWHYMPWGVTYVLDEFDNELDSTDFMKIADAATDARLYFKQHRKRQDDVIYAVQNIDNIWTRVRRMTESFIACTWNYRTDPLFARLPMSWSSFLRAEYGASDFNPGSFMSEGKFWYGEAKQMFTWYRTSQLVGDPRRYGWAGKGGCIGAWLEKYEPH